MLFFDISDTSIEVIKLSKSFLFGTSITAYSRVESDKIPVEKAEIQNPEEFSKLITDLLQKGQPKPIKDAECAFTLPDKRVYTHRFSLPQRKDNQTVLDLVGDEMKKIIPQPLEELSYQFVPLNEGGEEGEVFMMAAPTQMIKGYVDLFRGLKLEPRFVAPESYAAFRFLQPLIGEGLALNLDVGVKYTNAVFMDKKGVVETFSEPVKTGELLAGVEELLKFGKERFDRKAEQVFLGGGGSSEIDSGDVGDKLKIKVVSVEEGFGKFKIPIKVNFGKWSKVMFLNVLGLALMSKEKNPVSLPF